MDKHAELKVAMYRVPLVKKIFKEKLRTEKEVLETTPEIFLQKILESCNEAGFGFGVMSVEEFCSDLVSIKNCLLNMRSWDKDMSFEIVRDIVLEDIGQDLKEKQVAWFKNLLDYALDLKA
jgi:hypothetical protein